MRAIRLAASLTAFTALLGTSTPVLAVEAGTEPLSASNEVIEEDPGPPQQANGEIKPLKAGQRAPWTGMLIEQRDLVRWRLEIDNLTFRLDRDLKLAADKCDVRLNEQTRLTEIESERASMKDALWRERVEELATRNVQLQKDVVEANQVGFFEQPIVWYVGGIVSAGLLAFAVSQ